MASILPREKLSIMSLGRSYAERYVVVGSFFMTKNEALELIGKDEVVDETNVDYSHNESEKKVRNRFRNELREKLKDYSD